MGINVFPTPTTASSIATGWTAGVAGTFLLSNTLTTGTYLIKTDSTQTMTMTLVDSLGHNFTGTVRGGSGFISVPNDVNQIKVPTGMTYPFGIEITPISVIQLAAPTSASLSLGVNGVMTGTWGTVPTGAVSAHLLTTTGSILDFSSTASGATVTVSEASTTPGAVNNFVVAFKNSSGAWGIGAVVPTTMPASPYPYNYEYLVVGAGGSGSTSGYGTSGAGGGAVKTSVVASASIGSTLTISVAGVPGDNSSGGSSTFTYNSTTITATGGARGVGDNQAGISGSSGSGGNSSGTATSYAGGTGLDGGNGGASGSGSGYSSQGGGGGAGGNASGWSSGIGIASSITGVSTYYAGGGAGGQYSNSGSVGAGGTARNFDGAVNTGAGAGAGGGQGALRKGGSGVVIIAYPSLAPTLTTIPGTLTYTVDTTTRAGYRVYKFTAGSGTVTI